MHKLFELFMVMIATSVPNFELMHKPKLQPLEQIGFLPLNIWP
jgi:hypothetical protein